MPMIAVTDRKVCLSRKVDTNPQAQEDGGGEIYLTFDYGPLDSTLDVLDILLDLNVRATFGSDAEENEYDALQAFKRLIDDGHVISNHSFDHMSHNLPMNGYKGTFRFRFVLFFVL